MKPKTRSTVLQSSCITSEIFHEYNYGKWHLQKIYDHGKKSLVSGRAKKVETISHLISLLVFYHLQFDINDSYIHILSLKPFSIIKHQKNGFYNDTILQSRGNLIPKIFVLIISYSL